MYKCGNYIFRFKRPRMWIGVKSHILTDPFSFLPNHVEGRVKSYATWRNMWRSSCSCTHDYEKDVYRWCSLSKTKWKRGSCFKIAFFPQVKAEFLSHKYTAARHKPLTAWNQLCAAEELELMSEKLGLKEPWPRCFQPGCRQRLGWGCRRLLPLQLKAEFPEDVRSGVMPEIVSPFLLPPSKPCWFQKLGPCLICKSLDLAPC